MASLCSNNRPLVVWRLSIRRNFSCPPQCLLDVGSITRCARIWAVVMYGAWRGRFGDSAAGVCRLLSLSASPAAQIKVRSSRPSKPFATNQLVFDSFAKVSCQLHFPFFSAPTVTAPQLSLSLSLSIDQLLFILLPASHCFIVTAIEASKAQRFECIVHRKRERERMSRNQAGKRITCAEKQMIKW